MKHYKRKEAYDDRTYPETWWCPCTDSKTCRYVGKYEVSVKLIKMDLCQTNIGF